MSDPTAADQGRVCMCCGSVAHTMGHNGPRSLSHCSLSHSPCIISWVSGVMSKLDSSVCFFPKVSNCNKHREEADEDKHREENTWCQSPHYSYRAELLSAMDGNRGDSLVTHRKIEYWGVTVAKCQIRVRPCRWSE